MSSYRIKNLTNIDPAYRARLEKAAAEQGVDMGNVFARKAKRRNAGIVAPVIERPIEGRPPSIEFVLPELLPRANDWDRRWHWSKQMDYKRRLAKDMSALTQWRWAPYQKAKITVTRRTRNKGGVELDDDGRKYMCKPLLDAMQGPPQKTYGVGIIVDDGPKFIDLVVDIENGCDRAETVVCVVELA